MTMFDFQITIEYDGILEQRSFYLGARSLAIAVQESLALLMRDQPTAAFKRLTWFHPPL
jgi:hypothetical protein